MLSRIKISQAKFIPVPLKSLRGKVISVPDIMGINYELKLIKTFILGRISCHMNMLIGRCKGVGQGIRFGRDSLNENTTPHCLVAFLRMHCKS